MATHGYVVFLIRANPVNRPKELYRLSSVGSDGGDLFGTVQECLAAMGTSYHPDEKSAEGFKVKAVETVGRSIFAKINRGPAGTTGETYHLDTGEAKETSEREALLSGLRAMFFLPEDSYYGLLFVERIGRRNLRETINEWVIRQCAFKLHAVIRLESFAEVSDWESELADKQVLRISEVLESKSTEDDHSTPNDTLVHVAVEGGRIRTASADVKGYIMSRITRRDKRLSLVEDNSALAEKKRGRTPSADAFTIQDEEELKSVTQALADLDRGGNQDEGLHEFLAALTPHIHENFDHKRFEVSLGVDRPERVFSVERDNIPQYVYRFGGYLDDVHLRSAWVHHAQQILRHRRVQLKPGVFAETSAPESSATDVGQGG